MLMRPPTVPKDYVPAVHAEEFVHALQLIVHATAPTPDGDGGHHEAAYELAMGVLKRVEARKEYDKRLDNFDFSQRPGDGA
jgi:hypothetical protein